MTFQTNFLQIPQYLVEEVSLSSQRNQILEHLLSLDKDSRNNRFNGNVKDSYIQAYVDSLDKKRDRLYGIFQREVQPVAYDLFSGILPFFPQIVVPQIKPKIIGLSHISMYSRDGTNLAELALSVLNSHQKKGLGSMLVEDAILYRAKELGIEEVICQCLYTNRKVQELLKREGSKISSDISSNSSQGKIQIPLGNNLQHIIRKFRLTPLETISMIGNRSFI